MIVQTTCKNCSTTFDVRQAELNRGNGKFCCRECSHEYRRKAYVPTPKVPNLECAFCGAAFYRQPSHLVNSKSGLYFCGRPCKEKAQVDPSFGISPAHYGIRNGKYSYRKLAFENYEHKCSACGYDKHTDVLQVHHLDANRENNELSNLRILCPTCHIEAHRGHLQLA